MSHPDPLTTEIHNICTQFVKAHFPDESDLFDIIWDSYWQVAGCNSIDGLVDQIVIHNEDGKIFQIGATGMGDDFESSSLAPIITLATISLQKLARLQTLQYEDITSSLKNAAQVVGASETLIALLAEDIASPMAKLFKVPIPKNMQSPQRQSNYFLVDWCNNSIDPLVTPVANRERLDIETIQERYRIKRRNYILFVDELVSRITVGDSQENLWDKLGPSHLSLLGMILTSFKTRGPLYYKEIAQSALLHSCSPFIERDVRAVQRCLSDLNRITSGVLKNSIKASKTQEAYEPTETILPYCWIRPTETSRLARTPEYMKQVQLNCTLH